MKRIKQFSQILLISIFLSSCSTSINKESPINNSEENINEVVINGDVVIGKGKPIVAYSKKKSDLETRA